MTIEFLLWVPIIVALLVAAIDATTLYVMHTEMSNVARDTVRRMVTGVLRSEQDAEDYALNAMNMRVAPYSVDATYDEPNGVVMLRIAIAYNHLSILGYGSPLTIFGNTLSVRAVMRPDPRMPFGRPSKKNSGTSGGTNA